MRVRIHRRSWGSELTILEAAGGLCSEVESPNSTLEYSLFQNFIKRWESCMIGLFQFPSQGNK